MAAFLDVSAINWPIFAISGPVLWAISIHCDKYLLANHLRGNSAAVLLIFTTSVEAAALPIIWLFKPSVLGVPSAAAGAMMLSGVLYMAAMFFYFHALKSDDASVVSPFFQTAPLFGYLLGYFVLGEQLSALQFVGGALVLGGALLISMRLGAHAFRGLRYRMASLMLLCAFAIALSTLIFKIAAVQADFWTTVFWMYVGGVTFGLLLLINKVYRTQFRTFRQSTGGVILLICGCNELINLSGNLLTRYALLLAPLSLVQAMGGTTPVFVLVFGLLLHFFSPSLVQENLSLREFAQKAAAIALVVIGAMIIALA